jgi:hypothetical protein
VHQFLKQFTAMDAQTHDNHNHETTGAVAKSGLQLQRAPTYLLLYGFGLSTNLCTGLRPSISSPSSPTPPPVLALLYIVLVPGSGRAGGLSAGGQRAKRRQTGRMNNGVRSIQGNDGGPERSRTTPWGRRRRRRGGRVAAGGGREARAVAVEGYLDVRGGRRRACAAPRLRC